MRAGSPGRIGWQPRGRRALAQLALCVIGLIVVTVAMRSEWRPLRSAVWKSVIVEDVNDRGASLRQRSDVSANAEFNANGLVAVRGQSVSVVMDLSPARTGATTRISLWAYHGPGLQSVYECSADGVRFVEVASNLHSSGDLLPLESCGSEPVALRMSFALGVDAPVERMLVFDRLVVSAGEGLPSAPGLTALATAWLLIVLAAVGPLVWNGSVRSTIGSSVAAATTIVWVQRSWPEAFTGSLYWNVPPALAVAAVLLAVVCVIDWRVGRSGHVAELLLVSTLLVCAMAPRWAALQAQLVAPLSPDAQTVGVIAGQMRHAFDTGAREPLWPWLVRLITQFLGDDVAAGRLLSFTAAAVWLLATYAFARVYWRSRWKAAAVVALLALNPALIASSAQAHRTELYGLFLVLIAIGTLTAMAGTRLGWLSLGIGGPGVVLTQMAGVIPAVAALLWGRLTRRIGSGVLAAAVVAMVVTAIPHGLYTYLRYGQAFYFQQTLVPVFYRNVEFMAVRRTGCEGCPTPEEMARSSYSGQPTTMFHYLFGLHDVREVLDRIVDGHRRVFFARSGYTPALLGIGARFVFPLYVIGVIVALATRARELLIVPLVSLNLLAFVVPIGIDQRLLLHMAPFVAMCAVLGASSLLAPAVWLARHWRRGPVGPSTEA